MNSSIRKCDIIRVKLLHIASALIGILWQLLHNAVILTPILWGKPKPFH